MSENDVIAERVSRDQFQKARSGYEAVTKEMDARTFGERDDVASFWDEENYMLTRFPDDFEADGWGRIHLEATTKWKWPGLWSNYGSSSENTEKRIDDAIHDAVALDDAAKAVERLNDLTGVADATATVLLTFSRPEAFTVMDVNVLAALDDFGLWDGGKEAEASAYPSYLALCHEISDSLGMNLRDVDRALWKIGADLDEEGH